MASFEWQARVTMLRTRVSVEKVFGQMTFSVFRHTQKMAPSLRLQEAWTAWTALKSEAWQQGQGRLLQMAIRSDSMLNSWPQCNQRQPLV